MDYQATRGTLRFNPAGESSIGSVQTSGIPAADLVIGYSTPDYRVTWKYDRAGNVYRRWQGEDEQRGGQEHVARHSGGGVEPEDVHGASARASRRIFTAIVAAPKPLSMLTTPTPEAQEHSMASRAASP